MEEIVDKEPAYASGDEIYGEMLSDVLRDKRPDILDAGVSVGVVRCSKKKVVSRDHIVFGECKKIDEIYKIYCPYDFLIIIYEENCAEFSEEQMRILLYHELLHIGIDDKGKPYKKAHDIEEFNEIFLLYGLNWHRK